MERFCTKNVPVSFTFCKPHFWKSSVNDSLRSLLIKIHDLNEILSVLKSQKPKKVPRPNDLHPFFFS